MPIKSITSVVTLTLSLSYATTSYAGWTDFLDKVLESPKTNIPTSALSSEISQADMSTALKQALDNGVKHATQFLGKENGYFGNPKVKIPVPDSLSWAEKGLRSLGQGQLIDDFELTLNRSAEKAAPQVLSILQTAVTNMSLADAESILRGPDDAATQYFRRTSESALAERIRPIVTDATQEAGVTASYKAVVQRAGFMGQFVPKDATDLDGYITKQALEGLFVTIAEEEKRIRENPVARTTDIMKKVFSAYTQ